MDVPAPDLSFLAVHALAHKHAHGFSSAEKTQFALQAVRIMAANSAVHPKYPQLVKSLPSDEAAQYGVNWARATARAPQNTLDDDQLTQLAKADVLAQFVPLYKRLFVLADFHMLNYHTNRTLRSILLAPQAADHALFVQNRCFEMLFYQVAAALYGQLWFPSYLRLADSSRLPETLASRKWLEKRLETYYTRSQYLFKSLRDKPDAVVAAVQHEFDYYYLAKWTLAMYKFKENRFLEFAADFEALKDHLALLDKIGLQQEVLIMYAAASVCTKPFKELTFRSSEDMVELYTCEDSISSDVYRLLCVLLDAQFAQARTLLTLDLVQQVDAHMAYALPGKSAGTFWDYLSVIIELKVFLLIISISRRIPRAKMLAQMGYGADATQQQIDDVSSRLLTLISVLDLGERGISYDETGDFYYHYDVGDGVQVQKLHEKVGELDHLLRAEASAQLLRTMLVEKYFT